MTAIEALQEADNRIKKLAGCDNCNHYNHVRCRACTWDDAMSIIEDLIEELEDT